MNYEVNNVRNWQKSPILDIVNLINLEWRYISKIATLNFWTLVQGKTMANVKVEHFLVLFRNAPLTQKRYSHFKV